MYLEFRSREHALRFRKLRAPLVVSLVSSGGKLRFLRVEYLLLNFMFILSFRLYCEAGTPAKALLGSVNGRLYHLELFTLSTIKY